MIKDILSVITPELPRQIQEGIYPFTVTDVEIFHIRNYPAKDIEYLHITLNINPDEKNDKSLSVFANLYLQENTMKVLTSFAKSVGVNYEKILSDKDSIIGLTGKARFFYSKYVDCYGENTHRIVAKYFC